MNRFVWLSALVGSLMLGVTDSLAQTISLDKNSLEPVQVAMTVDQMQGRPVVRVVKDTAVKAVDQPTFVRIKDIAFRNGTIEVKVLSRLLTSAPELARGFIGVAFRINGQNTAFESIYLRPTNGRATTQLRRNRSIQYFSFPDYSFERLRRDAPGEYEAYADIGLNEWITMQIEVKDSQARLYLNDNKQPSLIVNDLKHGPNASGGIGLWVDVGTEGYFTDLIVRKQD